MTATTATFDAPRPAASIDRIGLGLLFAFVASLQISIAAASVLLTGVLFAWAALLVRTGSRPAWPPFFPALGAYAALTLLSAAFSSDPVVSFVDSKQLLVFLLVPAVYDLARGERATKVVDVIVTVGAASAAFGIVQYGMLHYDNLGQRPQGALTHYMTYSGVLMLVLCAAVARLVFGRRDRLWPALVMPALVVALSLTFTRSAWIGACVAVSLLFVLKDFRLTAVLPVVVAVLFAAAPDRVTNRMLSVFDLQDPTNRDRVAMLSTGAAMVRADPLTGVGPNMVPRVYATYRQTGSVEAINPHLHNVPVQIAAERGLPALAVWVLLIAQTARWLFRSFQTDRERQLPAAGLAALAAMLAAGLFEYNFGDSEFLMLLLVLVTLPFAAARPDAAPLPGA